MRVIMLRMSLRYARHYASRVIMLRMSLCFACHCATRVIMLRMSLRYARHYASHVIARCASLCFACHCAMRVIMLRMSAALSKALRKTITNSGYKSRCHQHVQPLQGNRSIIFLAFNNMAGMLMFAKRRPGGNGQCIVVIQESCSAGKLKAPGRCWS